MIKYKKIEVGTSTYEIASDDGCLVVKVNSCNVWLSKKMCEWIKNNYNKYVK